MEILIYSIIQQEHIHVIYLTYTFFHGLPFYIQIRQGQKTHLIKTCYSNGNDPGNEIGSQFPFIGSVIHSYLSSKRFLPRMTIRDCRSLVAIILYKNFKYKVIFLVQCRTVVKYVLCEYNQI